MNPTITFTSGFSVVRWALGTCGLSSISRVMGDTSSVNDQYKKLVDHKYLNDQGKEYPSGNILFSVTSTQIKKQEILAPLIKHLLNHPNTKCIHYYTNNAHAPNIVFICIHHKNTMVEPIKNNIEELKKRLYTNDFGQWKMKEAK